MTSAPNSEDQRLIADSESMSRWYPRFWLVRPMTGPARWEGFIKPFHTHLDTFKVVVEYRARPEGIPVVWIVDPEVSRRTHPDHPHLNSNGSACTFFVPDGDYRPLTDPIAILIDLVVDWLQRHVYWTDRGLWPGPQAPHDPEGVMGELQGRPSAPCVCGSGREFELCHGRVYRQGARRQREGLLHSVLQAHVGPIGTSLGALRQRWGPIGLAKRLPHLGPRYQLLEPRSALSEPSC